METRMETRMGKCIYCGRESGVLAESQEDANLLVTMECDCYGAETGAMKTILKDRINELAGELAPNNGFKPLDAGVFDLVTKIGDAVVEGKFASATLKVDGTAITIRRNGGKVSVFRSYTVKQGGSIEG